MSLPTRAPRFEVLCDITRPVLTGTTSEWSFSWPGSLDYGTISLMTPLADTLWIVDQAKSLGFDLCGVVRAEQFPELKRMPEWLARGYAGEMKYLADPRRSDPSTAMPGIRSAIVGLLNYNGGQPLSTDPAPPGDDRKPSAWISRYAWGDDYHDVLRERLDALIECRRHECTAPF